MGHILGLAHSNVPCAIMFPSNSPNLIKNVLSLDIIAVTERLYQIHKVEK